MADIELVIKIDEDIYNRFTHNEVRPRCKITEEERFQMNADAVRLTRAFCNGTQLPKGHGRLTDLDELINFTYNTYGINSGKSITKDNEDIIDYIYNKAETLIKADNAESEVEERKKTDDSIKVEDEVISEYNVKSVVFKSDDFDNLDSMLEDLWNDTESEMNE